MSLAVLLTSPILKVEMSSEQCPAGLSYPDGIAGFRTAEILLISPILKVDLSSEQAVPLASLILKVELGSELSTQGLTASTRSLII